MHALTHQQGSIDLHYWASCLRLLHRDWKHHGTLSDSSFPPRLPPHSALTGKDLRVDALNVDHHLSRLYLIFLSYLIYLIYPIYLIDVCLHQATQPDPFHDLSSWTDEAAVGVEQGLSARAVGPVEGSSARMSMPDKSEELELEGWEEVLETCGTASVGSQLWKRAWRRVSRHHPLDLESVISPGVSRPPFRPSLNNQSLWDRATSVLAAMDAAVPLEECSDDRQPPHRSRSADILPPELHDCIHRLRLLPSYGAPSLGLDLLSFAYPCRPSVVYTHDIPHIHIPSDNQTPLSAPHTLDTVVCLVRPSTAGQPPSLIAGYVYTDQSKTLASAWAFDVPRLELTVFEYNLTDSAKPLVKQVCLPQG